VDAVLAPLSPWFQVSKLEPPGLVATMPVHTHESATSLISFPDLTADGRRDRAVPMLRTGLARTRSFRDGSLLLQSLGQQSVQRPFDNRRGITVWQLVGQQGLQLFECVPSVLRDRHLELVTARRKRARIW